MPSFLSKVFGRKKDEKGASPVHGRGHDRVSLLDGKFEVVSPVTSPTVGDFPETSPRSRHTEGGSGLSNAKSPSASSPNPYGARDGFPQLPLSFSLSQEEAQAHALSTGFESYQDAQSLSDVTISNRRLTPLEALILVRICSQAIVARGLQTLGLMHPHWHSASPETQHRLISLFIRSLTAHPPQSSADSSSFSVFESEINYTFSPHDIAAVLRWGLRHLELGPGGFGKDKAWYRTFAEAERKAGYPPQTYSETLTPLIPTTHLELLDATLDLFSSLAAHSEENSISASKLTRAFGFWLLIAQRDRERDDWSGFYDGWQSSGRILEHMFLARIRDQSLKTRMPTRLTGLVARYPYIEGEKIEDDIFLHPQLSTRQFEALLVRVESEMSPKERAHRHPLQLVKDALVAQVMSVDDNELVSFWEKIKQSGNDEGEVTPGGYPGISRIFADDTLRYLTLIPGNHPWKKSTSPTFNLSEVQNSPIFRRLASSSGPSTSENEGLNGNNTNGSAKYNSNPASPSTADTSTTPSDWFQFSSAGFTDTSPSSLPLASTLFGQDVEKTHPPTRTKRSSRIRSRSPSRSRKSTERAASPLPPPIPPVPDLPQQYAPIKPIFKTTTLSLVKVDEAFVEFWVDALLDSVSSNWPKFVVCRVKEDFSGRVVNDRRVEYIVIEHVKRLIALPPPPAVPVPETVSTAPIAIPSTSTAERNNLERTLSPTKSLPSSPRSFKSEKQRFFNFFSSSTSSVRNSALYASPSASASATASGGVSDFGEVGKEREGKSSSTIVKLRMPSPKARKSTDAPPRRSGDLRRSGNADGSEQVRGRSTGEKEMGKVKEVEVEKKQGDEEKVLTETEKQAEAEGKKRETEEQKERDVEENKRKEAEEKTRKDSPSESPSIATSAVAATAVAVAALAVAGSQQATSQEDVDHTEGNQFVERQAEEGVVEQEPREERITPVDSHVATFEGHQAHVLDTIVESPTATEPTPFFEGQVSSTPSQETQIVQDTVADFSESEVVEEPVVHPSVPQEPETGVVDQPIEEENNVAPEPVAEVIQELVAPQEEASGPESVVVQAAPTPIAAEDEEHLVIEEPAAFSPPGLEPQVAVAVAENAQNPETAAVLEEVAEEDLASQPISAETAVSVTIPDSGPTEVSELTPVVEESMEDAEAVMEEAVAAEASPVVQEPVVAEELLVIDGPAAFDPSDIDAQVEEMNAQIAEETGDGDGDSEPASEEESVSVAVEEDSLVDAEVLAPIEEDNEGGLSPVEDSTNDVVVVEEPAVMETSVEEANEAPSVPSVVEASIPSPAPEAPVAEGEDEDVPVIEEEEQVAEAEAAPEQEEPTDEVAVAEPLEEPVSPIVEPSSLAVDEPQTSENPAATVEAAAQEPILEEIVEEEPATIDTPIQEVSSEPVAAVEPTPAVEESAITNEEDEVEEVIPTVEEDQLVEDIATEEDPGIQVPTGEESVLDESAPDAASLDEHHVAEEPVEADNTEAATPVAGGVSDEASSSDVVSGDQPTVVEGTMETPAEEGSIVDPSESVPVEHVAFEEPEVIEEPPAQEQEDESQPIKVINESSAEELQDPAVETIAVAEEDVMEVAKAEEAAEAEEVAETEEPAIVDEPLIEDHPTGPAEGPITEEPAAEEPPMLVEESSAPQPAEVAHAHDVPETPSTPATLLVSEATVAETPALEDEVPHQVTQPVDATPVIDEDAIDAAATAKPAEPVATPPLPAVAEEHEVPTISDEPSDTDLDEKIVASNGGAQHGPDSGVASGNGHHAIITEKENVSKEDQVISIQGPEPERTSDALLGSVPVLVED